MVSILERDYMPVTCPTVRHIVALLVVSSAEESPFPTAGTASIPWVEAVVYPDGKCIDRRIFPANVAVRERTVPTPSLSGRRSLYLTVLV